MNLPIWIRKTVVFISKPLSYRFSTICSSAPTSPSGMRKTYVFTMTYRSKFIEAMRKENINVLLLPPNGTHAMPHDKPLEMILVTSYTGIFNLLDFAAGIVTTPKVNEKDIENLANYKIYDRYKKLAKEIGKDGLGLPLGVQTAGPLYKEETVLRVMKDIISSLQLK